MKKGRVPERLAALLVCLLTVHMILSAILAYSPAVSALAAEHTGAESAEGSFAATPSGAASDGDLDWEDEDGQPLILDYVPGAASMDVILQDATLVDATPSDATPLDATPSDATPPDAIPPDAAPEIVYTEVPPLVTLETGGGG